MRVFRVSAFFFSVFEVSIEPLRSLGFQGFSVLGFQGLGFRFWGCYGVGFRFHGLRF